MNNDNDLNLHLHDQYRASLLDQGPFVQRWLTANPRLKFNPLL